MIKKVLIANRGEIAVRIIRACRELGLQSVAVFTEPDRHALHVRMADEALFLGNSPLAGYLDAKRIVAAARESGCDALHPGYGFLAESPLLAELCERHAIRYVGAVSSVIQQMGDKTAARKAMRAAGIPVTPGSEGNLADLQEAERVAETIGYPVILKATSGGGGRGIRRCDDAAALRHHFPRVLSEASMAFGSTEVFLEKYITHPRHIEVQILADHHGHVVHLFERDCSIQRRYQKLIEAAPSPQLNEKQREQVGAWAVEVARRVGYVNAGTVEFLLAEDGSLYFMEMNTRLQVEHPITEAITGIDIVQQQLRIAAGEPLGLKQSEITRRGFAMELRINAEDPRHDFAPSFGTVAHYLPPGGPGIRIDSALYSGYTIPPYFDSLCAKLVVTADTWPALLARALRALDELQIEGIKTTRLYYRELLAEAEFQAGRFDTGYVEAHPELLDYAEEHPTRTKVLAIAAALAAAGI